MKQKRISFLVLIISCLSVFVLTITFSTLIGSREPVNTVTTLVRDCPSTMDQIRIKRYKYVEPLILATINTESASLKRIRMNVENYISNAKSTQKIEEISVYLRRLNDGAWFSINPNEHYNPASMSKIIYLITYLKEAENNPGLLNKKLYFARHYSQGNNPNILDYQLPENREYTVRELLTVMIKYSDNDATLLLSQNMNLSTYKQIFADFNIPEPPEFGEYFITCEDYSKFFRALYNGSYIKPELSDLGLTILTSSTFKGGILQGIDPNLPVAHKFGERIIGSKAQLHEFAIVFIDNNPYMLGIMSKGSSLQQLSIILGEVSKLVYTDYRQMFGQGV